MDKESTKHIGKYMRYDTKSNKIKTKAKAYSKKHPNTTSKGIKKLNKKFKMEVLWHLVTD